MKKIFLLELASPYIAVDNLIAVYNNMRIAATKENDLRNYLKAILMIESLYNAKETTQMPFFLQIEDDDSVDSMLEEYVSLKI